MKRVILTVATIMITGLSMAQWTKKTVNNGLDDPYKICYTAINNGAALKMEYSDSAVSFYLTGGYHCDEYPKLDMSFLVNNQWVKYSVDGERSLNSKTIFLTDKIENEPYFKSFLNASSVKIRINESYCTSDIYEFVMTGSTAAYNFIKTK
jgi:hypothetical protein